MSDIFQEVEEDLRRERLKKVWDRYGIFVLAAALAIVLVTGGYSGYEWWKTKRERAAGDLFVAALADAEGAPTSSVAETLTAFAEDAPAGYAMLARFRAATVYDQAGETQSARDAFAALAADSSVPETYRDVARLRLGQIELDLGNHEAVRQTVGPMAEDAGNAYNAAAQELMGLSAYAAGDIDAARRWYESLRDAAGVPAGVKSRARFMLALITQSSSAPSDAQKSDGAQETN